jgi:hypothetical protein
MKTFSRMLVLLAAVALFNCKGKDGEPGPAGATGEKGPAGAAGAQGPAGQSFQQARENGFIKGTIKGTRRDGTAFQEPFEYKMAYSGEGFEKANSLTHVLDLYRTEKPFVSDDMWGAYLKVIVNNKGAANQEVKFGNFYLTFMKQLDASTRSLFYFNGSAEFASSQVVLPVSRANNATYKLVGCARPYSNTYRGEIINGKSYTIFETTDGSQVFFASLSTSASKQFEYLIKADGTKVTSDATWNGVTYKYDSTVRGSIFVSASGATLHEVLEIPADAQTITNYTYNAATGDLTFDYSVKIEAFRQENTTFSPVEITGSVKATGLYDGMVSRRSFEQAQ